MKKRNNYNCQFYETVYEKNTGMSMTIPGQSYTVRDLVIRYQNGVPLPRVQMQFDDIFDEELNPMRKPDFDLTDIEEAENHVQTISEKLLKFKKSKEDENRLENDRKDHHHGSNRSDSDSPNGEGTGK